MITLSDQRAITEGEVVALYQANAWSAAQQPSALYHALLNSHSLITAREESRLIGLGNAISDGYLVVYYPHLLIHPDYQGQGIGRMIMDKMQERYQSFHMQMLTADADSVTFYQKLGFARAGQTQPMWKYQRQEH